MRGINRTLQTSEVPVAGFRRADQRLTDENLSSDPTSERHTRPLRGPPYGIKGRTHPRSSEAMSPQLRQFGVTGDTAHDIRNGHDGECRGGGNGSVALGSDAALT